MFCCLLGGPNSNLGKTRDENTRGDHSGIFNPNSIHFVMKMPPRSTLENIFYFKKYCKVVITSLSCLEAHDGFFRLSMKEKFDFDVYLP